MEIKLKKKYLEFSGMKWINTAIVGKDICKLPVNWPVSHQEFLKEHPECLTNVKVK